MLSRSRHSAGPSGDDGSIDCSSDGTLLLIPMARLRSEKAWVAVFGRELGRWRGLVGLPLAQRAGGAVLRQQVAQRGGTGARQTEPEQHRLDLLVVDLGVTPVPVLDLQAASEQRSDRAGERHLAFRAEVGVVVRRLHEHAQRLDHGLRLGTPVARTGLLDRAGKQFVNVHGKPPAHVTLPA